MHCQIRISFSFFFLEKKHKKIVENNFFNEFSQAFLANFFFVRRFSYDFSGEIILSELLLFFFFCSANFGKNFGIEQIIKFINGVTRAYFLFADFQKFYNLPWFGENDIIFVVDTQIVWNFSDTWAFVYTKLFYIFDAIIISW